MRFVIVTGMSGAGKSTALKMMEDIGFYCVDIFQSLYWKNLWNCLDLQQNAELQKSLSGSISEVDRHLRNSEVCLTGSRQTARL